MVVLNLWYEGMNQTKTLDVALFPIPGMVTFPGTKAPLHVFEPRYRAMVKFCIENDMMLAVSHVRKALETRPVSPLKKFSDTKPDLNTNLQSYESQDVFSAGLCELIETTDDGRMHIDVHFQHRLRKLNHLQEVPFQTVCCEIFEDRKPTIDQQKIDDLLAELQMVVSAISKKASPALYAILQLDDWQNLSAEEFSFQLFTYFKFEPEFMQEVLQQDQVDKRLKLIWMGLSRSI